MPDRRGTAGQRDSGAVLARLAFVLRRISGMPDYADHLEHLRRYHPAQTIPTEREFYEEFIQTRYGNGTTRCC
ncbi:MAG TPA: YbdD/YjiX family protein [Gemmatimonadales bacterium]|nr:YbdD/YjiX family protein [Gemmatimonadales bacterium]